MKQLAAFIRKEFYHVFRDSRTLLILFVLPVVQIVLFGFALSSEVKNIGIAIQDNARDLHSQQIINRIKTSSYFQVKNPVIDYKDIENRFKNGGIKCAVIIRPILAPTSTAPEAHKYKLLPMRPTLTQQPL